MKNKNYKKLKLYGTLYILGLVSISFMCLLLLQSCSQDDDPFQDDLVYIYAMDPNKGQYEWDMQDYEYLYLAHSVDRSCETYSDWVTLNYTSNGPMSYEHYLIYYFTPPFANGYGSKPDKLIYSNVLYDLSQNTDAILCQNNLDEKLLVKTLGYLIGNQDFVTNLN